MNKAIISRVRIAVVDDTKCKPKKCNLECKKLCPVERSGKECVSVNKDSRAANISEVTCIGCNICVKKCPFDAITIINLPTPLEGEIAHRYGPNAFMLHRFPRPRRGQVLGIVGSNGTGKSTALKILSGKMLPNFNNFENPPKSWDEVIPHFRGSELQNYFGLLSTEKTKVTIKPQHIVIRSTEKEREKTVIETLKEVDTRGVLADVVMALDMTYFLQREVNQMSGGETQRFAIAYACCKQSDIYLFDEPSNYLDIKQRINAARTIRSTLTDSNYVIVVEHDLSMLDFLSDHVCILYGTPGAYGVATMPYAVREGINIFLDGYLPAENVRFRLEGLDFNLNGNRDTSVKKSQTCRSYPIMTHQLGDFKLQVEAGDFNTSEIIVLLGENGCGKSTFIKLLHKTLNDEGQEEREGPSFVVSYKPQQLSPKFQGTVRQLLQSRITPALCDPVFTSDVVKPLHIDRLLDLKVLELSGGELQKVALCLALGKPADVYLLDEPSSYLDSEQRVVAAKVIKRYIMHTKTTAFVVEHDFIMATYLADRVIVYDGIPSLSCVARCPQTLVDGMNCFLKSISVTLRRDPANYRPRINKHNCLKDREQKLSGKFYYTGEDENDRADY